ncbi:MAG: kynureninase [Symbiobacteriaceae bacterium]|jgi:kynureninase|nr:kynureninase [Symbiobacteriaceae bacterium]
MTSYKLGPEYALARDSQDPLRHFRERFYVDADRIYLDGNSLGLASKDAEAAVLKALADWKRQGIDGWTGGERPWFYMAEELGAMQADLMGAKPSELVVTGTTTVNLHALVSTFYRPSGRRTKILADELNFPSDIYALQSQVRLKGCEGGGNPDLILARSQDGRTLSEDDLIAAMTDEVALVVLPGVLYRSGQLLDMERLTREAHARSILIGFDCCHSAGAVPHHLHDWDVDFAFWCTYKYLNAGPGAVATLFVNERHFGALPGLAGWFGCDKQKQFDMELTFYQAPGAGAWQISSPNIFSAAPLYGSLAIHREAGMEAIRAKSLDQTGYLMFLIDEILTPYGFTVGNPREAERRGGHVALEHPDAVRICKALKAEGVIPDFRAPNVVRLAPVALYNTYSELWQTVQILKRIVTEGLHEQFSGERGTVA